MVTSMVASMASWFTPTVLFCVLNLMIGTIFIASNFKTHNHPQRHGEENPPQLVRAPSLLDRVRSIDFSHYKFLPETQHTDSADDQAPPEVHNPPQLVRAPSLLERVRSFDFSHYKFPPATQHIDPGDDQTQPEVQNPPKLVRTPSLLERVWSINFSRYKSDLFLAETHYTDPQEDQTTYDVHNQNPSQGLDHHVTRSMSDTCVEAPARVPSKMRKSASEKTEAASVEDDDDVDRRRPATVREGKRRGSETASFGEDEEGVDAKADDFINRFRQQLKLQRLDSFQRYKEMLARVSGK